MSKITTMRRSVDGSVNELAFASTASKAPELLRHLDDVKELRKALDALACVGDAVTKVLGGSASGLNGWVQRLAERSKDETMPSVYVAMNKSTQDKYGEVLATLAAAAKLADALKVKTYDAGVQLQEAQAVHKRAMNKILTRFDPAS